MTLPSLLYFLITAADLYAAVCGYARVSTADQSLNLQIDTLKTAGCEHIFEEKASDKKSDRVELTRCLEYLRPGDTLVIWKLDRWEELRGN
jgi:DNA invertase Pin-like site-specific DNA recombinase